MSRRRGLWWELRRAGRRARRQMMPHRVLWRLLSGPEVVRALRGHPGYVMALAAVSFAVGAVALYALAR